MLKTSPLTLAALCLGLVSTVQAETFKIDPDHTDVAFMVSHLGYSDMIGEFYGVEGEFTYDQNDPAASSVTVIIPTATIDTRHEDRDQHLRSPDFFNAVEFPEMTFESTEVKVTGEDTLEVTGDLSLLGVTKPVTLEVTVNKVAPHPLPNYNGVLTAGFSARTTLNRSDFGMNTFLPAIGDEVRLLLEVEGMAQ
ncbi:MAG: YceI family protein [Candidatus Competibacteraceae bacterium]|nr:YceI family protein [Candidatus Competibacteraceae bacterium]